MTPKNLRANVEAELQNAERLLRATRALLDAACFPDAANRAYYTVFHLTQAALLVVGHEAHSHGGARALLGSALVHPKHLPARATEIFAELERLRHASDYRRFVEVTREQAEAAAAAAKEYETLIRALVAIEGF